MSHMLEARWFGGAPGVRYTSKVTPPVDDALGAPRGIAFGVLASTLFFWLPLAVFLWV
jgi:hypothetical protein